MTTTTTSDDIFSVEVTETDFDGDGISEGLFSEVQDLDGDGFAESYLGDLDDNGMIDSYLMDTDADGYFETVMVDTDGSGLPETAILDLDADGTFDATMTIDESVYDDFGYEDSSSCEFEF